MNREKRQQLLEDMVRFKKIGTRAVSLAIEENRLRGVPSAFSRDGSILYEMPDGSIRSKLTS